MLHAAAGSDDAEIKDIDLPLLLESRVSRMRSFLLHWVGIPAARRQEASLAASFTGAILIQV
jgi:hypothetical protein